MEENTFEKFKSMLNNGNIPDDLKNIMSSINSSNKSNSSSSPNNSISPETINTLISMFNSKHNTEKDTSSDNIHNKTGSETTQELLSTYNKKESKTNGTSNNFNIDFETILKFKTIMDKMNSKDDPRSKLLISLKPYLNDKRKSKVDQYIQFFNMSKVIDVFSKSSGDDKS